MSLTRQERHQLALKLAFATDSSPEICAMQIHHYRFEDERLAELALRLSVAPAAAPPSCPACYVLGRIRPLLCQDGAHQSLHGALARYQKRKAGASEPVVTPAPPPPQGILDQVDLEDVIRQCSSKKRYSSEAFAKGIAAKCYQDRSHLLRAYHCPICLGFHLTHHATPPPELAATT